MPKLVGSIIAAIFPALFFALGATPTQPEVSTVEAEATEAAIPDLLAMVDKTEATDAEIASFVPEPAETTNAVSTDLSSAIAVKQLVGNATSLTEYTPTTSISRTFGSGVNTFTSIGINTTTTAGPLGTVPNSIVETSTTQGTVDEITTTTQNNTTTTNQTTTTTSSTSTTASNAGRTLVFADEFDSLNSTRWKSEYSTYGDGNNELQCYLRENVKVEDGKLVLTAKKETAECPYSTRQYSSGMVRSSGFTFSPGQSIEYRVKLTPNDDENQGGLWPAFWSSSWAGGGWPNGGEWDGFEVMTARSAYRSVYSIHYKNTYGNHGKKNKEIYTDEKFSDNWHTMRFDYGHNGVLTWYFDGVIVQTITDADTIQGWPTPFDQSMKSFKINLALGGSPGPLDDRALPATYEVDYVRIYDM